MIYKFVLPPNDKNTVNSVIFIYTRTGYRGQRIGDRVSLLILFTRNAICSIIFQGGVFSIKTPLTSPLVVLSSPRQVRVQRGLSPCQDRVQREHKSVVRSLFSIIYLCVYLFTSPVIHSVAYCCREVTAQVEEHTFRHPCWNLHQLNSRWWHFTFSEVLQVLQAPCN